MMPLQSYTRTPEIKEKMRQASLNAWKNPEIRDKYMLALVNRNRDHSIFLKQGQDALVKCRQNPEWIRHLSRAVSKVKTGVKRTIKDPIAFSRQQSINSKKRIMTPEYRRRLSEAAKNRLPMSDEVKSKISKIHKLLWQNPSYAKRMVKGQHRKPNKAEQKLAILLGVDWKYVGDGEVWLGGRNPDFINTNGKKKVIELFSEYWHKVRARTDDDELDRLKHYKQYGFECLVIWQSELRNEHKLNAKIRRYAQ